MADTLTARLHEELSRRRRHPRRPGKPLPRARDHGVVRTVRLRQDHRAALPRRTGASRGGLDLGSATKLWFDADAGIFLTPQQRGIGFVFQDYALFPHLTVADNIGYSLAALTGGERRERVDEIMARFELADVARQFPRQLSGGQQQRVALARAVVCRPRLLLLDEPLSALDTALREELRGDLCQQLRALDIPVLLVTHDRAEARLLGDHLVVMHGGRVQQAGPAAEVFARPENAVVRRALGLTAG